MSSAGMLIGDKFWIGRGHAPNLPTRTYFALSLDACMHAQHACSSYACFTNETFPPKNTSHLVRMHACMPSVHAVHVAMPALQTKPSLQKKLCTEECRLCLSPRVVLQQKCAVTQPVTSVFCDLNKHYFYLVVSNSFKLPTIRSVVVWVSLRRLWFGVQFPAQVDFFLVY